MSVNPLKDLHILVPGNGEGVNTMRGKDRKCSFQQWFSHIHLERQTFIKWSVYTTIKKVIICQTRLPQVHDVLLWGRLGEARRAKSVGRGRDGAMRWSPSLACPPMIDQSLWCGNVAQCKVTDNMLEDCTRSRGSLHTERSAKSKSPVPSPSIVWPNITKNILIFQSLSRKTKCSITPYELTSWNKYWLDAKAVER